MDLAPFMALTIVLLISIRVFNLFTSYDAKVKKAVKGIDELLPDHGRVVDAKDKGCPDVGYTREEFVADAFGLMTFDEWFCKCKARGIPQRRLPSTDTSTSTGTGADAMCHTYFLGWQDIHIQLMGESFITNLGPAAVEVTVFYGPQPPATNQRFWEQEPLNSVNIPAFGGYCTPSSASSVSVRTANETSTIEVCMRGTQANLGDINNGGL